MVRIIIMVVLSFFLFACTTTGYDKKKVVVVQDVGGVVTTTTTTTTTVDHFTMGMEREGVDLMMEREDELKAHIKIGKSSGTESFDRAISGLETTLDALKGMRP